MTKSKWNSKRHECIIQTITENMKMSKKNMNEACAKLAAKVSEKKLSQTFQEWNNPSFGQKTVPCIKK